MKNETDAGIVAELSCTNVMEHNIMDIKGLSSEFCNTGLALKKTRNMILVFKTKPVLQNSDDKPMLALIHRVAI